MATSARLEELQHKFNENPRRYFAPLANEHRKLGDLDQAITLCRTHLPQQPQHVSGHIVLAQALFEAGSTPDARQAFELALDLDPENLIALRFLGDIARGQGDHLTARHWYERVLDADPRNDEIARLIRDLENGAAAPAAVMPQSTAPAEPVENTAQEADAAPEAIEVEAAASEPNEEPAAVPTATQQPIDDLATAWQHEVSALDERGSLTADVAEPAVQSEREPEPVTVDDSAATREPELEIFAQSPETVEASVAGVELPAEPNESWAEPDEEFVATVPTVESSMLPAPTPFAEIDYSMFEAVADEDAAARPTPVEPMPVVVDEVVASPVESALPAPEEAREQPHAATDDWFAGPSAREAEATSVEVEAAFDLDAAFQSVLPNTEESEDETFAPAQDTLVDFVEVPQSNEWDVSDSSAPPPAADEAEFTASLETSLEAALDSTDGVDDAFAVLDRMTASLEADIANSAMLLPDEDYSAPQEIDAPQHVDALIGRTPETDVPAIEEQPIAFVTETMAELYLQQGFREEALAVYRQLLEMNPNDSVLAGRVRALEGHAEEAPSSDDSASFDAFRLASPATAHADAAGQSMRAFLSVFARRRAPMRRREQVTNDVRAVETPRESVLSALFGEPRGTDDGAAAMLAGAFAQPNAESETLPGRPTRAAAEELSLGDVFSGSVATSGARAATFDEFFSTGTAEQSARSPLDEEGSDMEQFTAWLEGLKKK